jgi:adenine-specific DNA-methyltransferase
MSARYEKLKTLLKELFQLDQPDLDFGLYRIMHAKSGEVTAFLDADLLPQVKEAFALYQPADKAALQAELDQIVSSVQAAGMNPDDSPKVRELREKIASSAVDIAALEAEVYDHLYSFFRRYYSEGDFLSKRVYKEGVYAIPYEGEEVTLHWANKDQYYIKTSEYLRDYCIRLRPDDEAHPMRVHFRLTDAAEGEHGNVKATEGKDRVFVLAAAGDSGHEFLSIDEGPEGPELSIRFEYRPATLTDWPAEVREGKTKPPAQKELTAVAVGRALVVAAEPFGPWIAELRKPHVTASGEAADYSRLEGHLKRYTARNTFDYFIHKDLGTFLRRELDFYIKNEVMHLDDIENEKAARVEQYLSKIKVIRRIAGKIIDFLAQLEDFQKKLWLKKKFVVETQWCVRVGCIPEEFYEEIAANDAQREEWVSLCAIHEIEGDLTTPGYSTPLTPTFLKAHATLVVDTRHFDSGFTARLLEAIGDIDEQTDGVLFHSENFQALSLALAKSQGHIRAIYIDPPYNTGGDSFAYRDGYQRSSWLSLMESRLNLGKRFLAPDGLFACSIDDNEILALRRSLEDTFGADNFVSQLVVQTNPKGRVLDRHISRTHDYLLMCTRGPLSFELGLFKTDEELREDYPDIDSRGRYRALELRNTHREFGQHNRPNLWYPLYVDVHSAAVSLERRTSTDVEVWPAWDDGFKGCWTWGEERAAALAHELVGREVGGRWKIFRKAYALNEDGTPVTKKPKSVLLDSSFSTDRGQSLLDSVLGEQLFRSPKPISIPALCFLLLRDPNARVLDYFGGSGTTAHAVISANRDDGGRRRVTVVEMGDHFDAVLLPRLKKVTYAPDWKDGKPKRLATPQEAERSPRVMKIVRLESYEDALNNLQLGRKPDQQLLLREPAAQGDGKLREQYLLKYMLDVETRGSQSLLNVAAFRDPTAYRLSVKRPGADESREVCVDLLETFNWLIGLTVEAIAAPQVFSAAFERDAENRLQLKGGRIKADPKGLFWFRRVEGKLPDGRKALIVWRKLGDDLEQANLVLDHFLTDKLKISTKDFEFDVIYVNGSNNLENLKAPDDTWKVRLLEEEFHRLMFATEDV